MDITLDMPSGHKMPQFGLGTWQVTDAASARGSVEVALDTGYKLIDTAYGYVNEHIIGDVLKERFSSGTLKREDIFVTSKLWSTFLGTKELVHRGIQLSLKNLQLDYVDLYLIHWPCGFQYRNDEERAPQDDAGNVLLDKTTDIIQVWQALEECVDKGWIKSIGVSNFNISQLRRVQAVARHPVAVNQVEMHLYFQQKPLVEFCKANNISVTAYSPLGSPASAKFWEGKTFPTLLQDETVLTIGTKKGKTAAQIALRFLLQEGVAVIPKSITPSRILENSQLSDFVLSEDEMDQLRKVDRNMRTIDPSFFKSHPESPFKE